MALSLKTIATPVQWRVLRKGPRVFALLGKPSLRGLAAFRREDASSTWALTAEFGCLRLERLSGDEEVTGGQVFLTTPFSYEYGVRGDEELPDLTRAVFGLLPCELEQLVSVLRRRSFPVLGFSQTDLRCGVSSGVIPGRWPHVVTSNLALYGNVVSLETFARIIVSSMPHGQLGVQYPALQPVFKRLMKLVAVPPRGVPYSKEMLELVPAPALVGQ